MSDLHPIFSRLEERYPDLALCMPEVEAAARLLSDLFNGDGKLLLCGNGGSAADCEHIVGELMKSFRLPRPLLTHHDALLREMGEAALADRLQVAFPAISLVSQTALITAIANDVAGDMVFAQQVYGYGKAGDVLLAISTSGNALSVLNAVKVAKALQMRVIGLTGRVGGLLRPLADVAVCVPHDSTADIQERHLPIYHAWCEWLEVERFG